MTGTKPHSDGDTGGTPACRTADAGAAFFAGGCATSGRPSPSYLPTTSHSRTIAVWISCTFETWHLITLIIAFSFKEPLLYMTAYGVPKPARIAVCPSEMLPWSLMPSWQPRP